MNKVKYFQRGGKNLPTAPDAKETYKGGTYVPSILSGEPNNNNYFRKPFTSRVIAVPATDYISREIRQFINPITNDTAYTEIPYHDTEVRIKPRRASTRDANRSEYDILNRRYNEAKSVSSKQQGGTMNQQQDIQQQVIQLVQAAMLGDQKATDTVNQIMQAAQQGDQQAIQLAQMIQQVMEQMKRQTQVAKMGSKLQYIRSLKYAKGGKTCPTCQQGGKPLQTNSVEKPIKKSKEKIEEKACGGKAKKYLTGDKFEDYYKFKRYGYQNDTLNLGPGYQVISQRFYPIYERLYEDPSYGIKRGSEVWFDSSTENGRNIYISPNNRDTVYFDTPTHYVGYGEGYMPVGKSENLKKSKEDFNKKYQDYESKKK